MYSNSGKIANRTAMPLISIVVPMRNAEAYVANCLKSILQEADLDIEVIVIDDKSEDRSRSIVNSIADDRIRLIDGAGTGISNCLNEGLSKAIGSIIMRCDADDLYPPLRIKQQSHWLDSHPEFDAVCGSFSTIDTKGRLITEMNCGREQADITDELRAGTTRTSFCTFAIRSSLLKRMGGFRSYFTTGEDVDFQLRLGEAGHIAYLPISWYRYRIHSSSITHTQKPDDRLFFEKISRTLQTQRRNGRPDDLDCDLIPEIPESILATTPASRHIQGLLLGRAWREHANGRRFRAIISGTRALAAAPLSSGTWKSVFALIIKSIPPAKH